MGLYIVLGTSTWNWIYGLALGLTYPEMSIHENAVHPSCIPGDWVLQTFQPMVSDERMIEHWKKHQADMTLAAEMVVHRQHVDNQGLTQEARMLYSKISVEGVSRGIDWSMEPYSVENAKAVDACLNTPPPNESQDARIARVQECTKTHRSTILLLPTFGKTHQQYFCTTQRNTFKQYAYFPGAIPRIVDGYLQGPVWHNGKTGWKRKIVPSTDVFDGKECTMRQLDARWFISLCG
ncbi:hypothetical protein LP417_13310 [Polaromonas sp. P1-6]|nr:hypothetical protein LP417_13310 [Polaromonas sp. P1-6]